MLTAPSTGGTAARTVDEQFFDLICSDADLVAAEFEAIVAAEWPEPPTRRPGRGTAGGHRGAGGARRPADAVRDLGPPACEPQIDRWARERSPPRRQTPPDPWHQQESKVGGRHTDLNQSERGDRSPACTTRHRASDA